jgi:dTDP-4-amino-4,6-dideoxygalactose transaminase
VCDSQRFIMGPEVEQLERELASTLGVADTVAVSSGTDALLAALMALRVGPGDDVIVPTFSFFATAGSVARTGARPVFVDVDPDTLMIDPVSVSGAITSRTRAVIPVHLFGACADMDALSAAVGPDMPIVEDAAQAIGACYDGRPAGGFGAYGCFSFFPSKNLGAFGDAGLVTTNDATLAARIRLLRDHGSSPRYYHREIGGNFRMDALQAAVLRTKLPHLAEWTASRQRNAAVYRELFAAAGVGAHVRLPPEPARGTHIYHQFVIRVKHRDALRAHLTSCDVDTEIYYPVPFHRQECFAYLGQPLDAFPHADAAAAEVLALPIYPGLTRPQQEHVVSSIAGFFA